MKLGWCMTEFHRWSKPEHSRACPGEHLGHVCSCRCHEAGMTKSRFTKLKRTTPKTKAKKGRARKK